MNFTGDKRDDSIHGGAEADLLSGKGGDDVLRGAGGDDTVFGGAGDDLLFAGLGNDALIGGAGDDVAIYQGGDFLYFRGGHGFDILDGTRCDGPTSWFLGDDIEGFRGGSDADYVGLLDVRVVDRLLDGRDGDDDLDGGGGQDTLIGGAGRDLLSGYGGDDVLNGGKGVDTLVGGDGSDSLYGGGGRDILVGGLGADYMGFRSKDGPHRDYEGNHGRDVFFFNSTAEADGDTLWIEGPDQLDFRQIDADTTAGGNQAFVLTDQLEPGAAGKLVLELDSATGQSWFIYGDVDGDGQADFQLIAIDNDLRLAPDNVLL
jgi:Ca2+-binding RTX toxin-like protein